MLNLKRRHELSKGAGMTVAGGGPIVDAHFLEAGSKERKSFGGAKTKQRCACSSIRNDREGFLDCVARKHCTGSWDTVEGA